MYKIKTKQAEGKTLYAVIDDKGRVCNSHWTESKRKAELDRDLLERLFGGKERTEE